ncbi:hypothetical protein H4R21_003832 [Coemansia helicoidea]|uniref:Uncharacterized protein n=1 Tax=Coemansia helicoidea TaxID=1286919 RepID=A0ACC1L0Z5_9FUNG|nr:hypothetical protein H4R21_003832 [Coemansia helicoidea]
MQFLSVHDYLARCFELLQLESAHEIREDVEDAVRRLQPRATHERPDGGDDVSPANTHFAGWARMALPLQSFEVSDVQRPRLGEAAPARVRADISVDLADHAESIRREWDEELRPRDVLILCAAAPPQGAQSQRAVRAVRGCEIECRLDAAGRPLGAGAEADAGPNADDSGDAQEGPTRGSVRRFRVLLDPQQYHADIQAGDGGPYAALNVVVRRRPQESNFKAVLETVRDLMATPPALPDWLAATFLGYGDPAAAAAQAQWTRPGQVWFGDTFVSEDHVRECLAPFRVEFPDGAFATPCVVEFPADAAASAEGGVVRVTHAPAPSMGPAELAPVRANRIRFTAAQVAAIGAAAREGLTMIVGPPGTGKTDVAVQIVANLYHAHPRQKILMITHSNQALNQLFEKIIALDIEPRHLLRLGHGEGALDAEESYSRAGRVDSYLARRAELLADVRALAESLGVAGDDVGYTCANARFFHVVHVRMRWDAFRRAVLDPPAGAPPTADAVRAGFPFTRFFEARLGRPLFAADDDVSAAALAETAAGCFRWLERLFDELADIQPFELLRTRADCANYLLTNQARIVAMTCTHAALKRRDLVRLGFRYDTVVMEEAAQVLDVESFIPLTLRRPAAAATADGAAARELKRLVLIGDHNQLPPVVRSGGLRAFAGMDQSLFARLVRLGVPYIELNRQARARPAIADLYRFRYRDLGDLLPAVASGPFAAPNAALAHSFQFVDVGDFAGRGESEPRRFFYQNLGEAEYVVAAYQYLRLRGYPPERIAILTTYNGQRALIADVLERRCAWLPHFARPAAVSTVDQFQGQQCDVVLLSLVRTRAVGHVRDLRRLTVALSRARLGLYVFGRRALFESCFELAAPVRRLLANGDRLALCPDEAFGAPVPGQRSITTVGGVEELGAIVYKMIEDHLAHNDDPAADEPAAGGAGDSEGQDDASAEAQAAAPESESAPS